MPRKGFPGEWFFGTSQVAAGSSAVVPEMKCFVTGVSGFLGANVARELVRCGHEVRGLVRKDADLRALRDVPFEAVTGDVSDRPALVAAMKGCDWCFHVAASYHLWLPDYRPMYATNVDGTRNVLEAAGKAGCSRIVYTSTVGCVGLPRHDESGHVEPSDESALVLPEQLNGHYKRSKWQAEVVAFEMATKGLPVVVVNPSAPVGPHDVKPTPTGRIIVDFLNRNLPAYVDTGLNWVHVRDVAAGHRLAAEKGRVGERYILGNATGNWTMERTLEVLAELAGLPSPRFQIPYSLALAAAYFDEGLSWFSGRPPRAPLAGVRLARHKMYFSPAKAIRELDLPQTPPREAFAEAVAWFRENGYVGDK